MLKLFHLLQLVLIMNVHNCARAENGLNICPSEMPNPEYDGFRYEGLKIANLGGEYYGKVLRQDVCYVIFHKSVLDNFTIKEEGVHARTDSHLISEFCKKKFRSSSPGQTSILRFADWKAKDYIFNEWAKKNNHSRWFDFYHEAQLFERIEGINVSKQFFFDPPSQRLGRFTETGLHFTFEIVYLTGTKFFGKSYYQQNFMKFGFYDSEPSLRSDFFKVGDYEKHLTNSSYKLELPWCRNVIVYAPKRMIFIDEHFYTCSKERTWDWFTCAFKPYNHCLDRQKKLCGWKPDVLKCTEYSYERVQEREAPYGNECGPRDYGEPCSPCKTCETNQWGPWGAWTATCGNVTRRRWRPPDGESHIDCHLDETDCCQMGEWRLVDCPEERMLWQQKEKTENPIAYFLFIPATFALILCLSTLYIVYKSRKAQLKRGESMFLKVTPEKKKDDGIKKERSVPASSIP
ncbi:hypothetical protein D918_06425 [Trichuris suis]|nr:hypothetical protein D918_06425 [Trichuris suis]